MLPQAQLREYPLAAIAVSVEEFTWFADYFSRHFTVDTFANAARLLKETGCAAVKLEGGEAMAPTMTVPPMQKP